MTQLGYFLVLISDAGYTHNYPVYETTNADGETVLQAKISEDRLWPLRELTPEEKQNVTADYRLQPGDGDRCTCWISNWASLSCPLHGLEAH